MFYEKQYNYFSKKIKELSNVLKTVKGVTKFEKMKNGSTFIELLNETIRDCHAICRKITLINKKYSPKEITLEMIQKLDKEIFLLREYKIKVFKEYIND